MLLLALSLALTVLLALLDDSRLGEALDTFKTLLDIIRVMLSIFA